MRDSNKPNRKKIPSRFSGTDNPRHLRAIRALQIGPRAREAVDRISGASNGPELISELRRRGLQILCEMTPCSDRDGREVKRGVYYFTEQDRREIRRWLKNRIVKI
jgi:hypothetical protein